MTSFRKRRNASRHIILRLTISDVARYCLSLTASRRGPQQPKCKRRVSDHRIDSFPISAPLPATADHRRATGISNPQKPSPIAPPGLWDAATGTFHGALLRRAIVARGWTVRDFAAQARLNICSVYNAMHGKPVRDGTTIRIFEALEKRAPMMVVLDREGSGR